MEYPQLEQEVFELRTRIARNKTTIEAYRSSNKEDEQWLVEYARSDNKYAEAKLSEIESLLLGRGHDRSTEDKCVDLKQYVVSLEERVELLHSSHATVRRMVWVLVWVLVPIAVAVATLVLTALIQ